MLLLPVAADWHHRQILTEALGSLSEHFQLKMVKKMTNPSEERYKRQQRRITFIFHFSWITVFSVLVLLMRVWIGPVNLAEDLDALEEAETENVSLDRPLPPT